MSPFFSLFLALRYLKPKRTYVSIITLISIIGVALGVTVLIVVISVMTGFEQEIKKRLLGFQPHILLEYKPSPFDPSLPAETWPEVIEQLHDIDEIAGCAALVQGQVLLEFKGRRIAPLMRALSDHDTGQLEQLESSLVTGSLRFDHNEVVISKLLADALGIAQGDVITIYSPSSVEEVLRKIEELEYDSVEKQFTQELEEIRRHFESGSLHQETSVVFPETAITKIKNTLAKILEGEIRHSERLLLEEIVHHLHQPLSSKTLERDTIAYALRSMDHTIGILDELQIKEKEESELLTDLKEIILPKEMVVSGILSLPTDEFGLLFVPFHIGQELYALEGSAHAISLRIADPYRAAEAKNTFQERLPPNWYATTWTERFGDLFHTIRNERAMMYFVLFFIILVASFSIMNTMITVAVQKRREIGVLKALGAKTKQIMWVFLSQGMIVGIVGTVLGLTLGTIVIHYRNEIKLFLGKLGFEVFPEQYYGLAAIPAIIEKGDLTIICAGAFLLCSLAALPPAYMVARLDPAKALRNEG